MSILPICQLLTTVLYTIVNDDLTDRSDASPSLLPQHKIITPSQRMTVPQASPSNPVIAPESTSSVSSMQVDTATTESLPQGKLVGD